MADLTGDRITNDANIIKTQIQQKTDDGMIAIRPETDTDIVINKSTNVTGDTVTDAFDSALPLTAGKNISINTKDTGVEIAFTGSLAPNVSVSGENNNPVEVTGTPGDTSASYIVKHKAVGPSGGYSKTASIVSTISPGNPGIVTIPKITVDAYGHITAATNENVTIVIPSVDGMVTTASTTGLDDNKIILGTGDGNKVKASKYGISASLTAATNPGNYVPTVSAVKSYVDTKITNSVQYLGVGTGINSTTGSITGMDAPNSKGDWGRVTQKFTVPTNLSSSGTAEEAHVGDIVICTQINGKNPLYIWDVIHTEVDTDTWRPVQVNGADIDSSNTHPTLNLKAGTNVNLSNNSGTVTISATDTTYTLTQDTNTKNKFKFTPVGKTGTTITIDNVANAVNATTAITATTATKVSKALTVQFSGTTQFEYDGSEAKTLNVAAGNHTHGHITNSGQIVANRLIKDGDKIVITDSDNYITRSSIAFDGTTTTKALTQAGTWKSFINGVRSGTNATGAVISSTFGSDGIATLGDSGVTPGVYCALEVNSKGIVTAGAHVIKIYENGATIGSELVTGGFAFIKI